jgi:hypothetical protein
MAQTMPRGIDPKLTESCLLDIENVIDASVWWSDGNLRACVAVLDANDVDSRDLQNKCLMELGVHQTPRAITLMSIRPKTNQTSSSSSKSSISASSSMARLAA